MAVQTAAQKKAAKLKSKEVEHPSHYNNGGTEVWDYIEEQELNYLLGNVVKYISRAGKKDPETYTQDLEKARQYLNKELSKYDL